MKKYISLLMALVLLLCLSGCGQEKTIEYFGSEIKVGAIYITSQKDTAGYTYAHHNGIVTAMEALGLDVDKQLLIMDNVREDTQQVLQAIDTLVEQGANIIFGISFGYIDAMEAGAAKYPNVIFSHATGYKSNGTNFNNYFGRAYQARYLTGIAAGLKSLQLRNNNVGYVAAYGTDFAETASGINGFALGVRAVNPKAVVIVKTLGTWADEINEYDYAKKLIEKFGCGIIAQHCDSAQPQKAAQTAGAFGCGYNSDMTPAAPEAHLTAAIWNWDVYYRTAIEAAMTCGPAENFVKQMGGASYYEGLESGFIDISPLSDNCVKGTEKAVQQVKDLIVSGKWDVFSGTKLRISKDGTITVIDDDLMDSRGSVILPAGSAPIDDEIITGKMNYFVEGVQLAH